MSQAWLIITFIIIGLCLLYADYRALGRKGSSARRKQWGVNMTTYQVHRSGHLMKSTQVQSEAEKEFEALEKRHPQSCICLTKVDVLQSTPALQAFNIKREQSI